MNTNTALTPRDILPYGNPFTECCDPQCQDPTHQKQDSAKAVNSQKNQMDLHFSACFLKEPLVQLPSFFLKKSKKIFVINFLFQTTTENIIKGLPSVIIKHILFNCSMSDIISFSKTCKNFRKISLDNFLWQPLFLQCRDVPILHWKDRINELMSNWITSGENHAVENMEFGSDPLKRQLASKNYFYSFVGLKEIIPIEMKKCKEQIEKFGEEIKQEGEASSICRQFFLCCDNDDKTSVTLLNEESRCLDKKHELEDKQAKWKNKLNSCESITLYFKMLLLRFHFRKSPSELVK